MKIRYFFHTYTRIPVENPPEKTDDGPPPDEKRCVAETLEGDRCKRKRADGSKFCSLHPIGTTGPSPTNDEIAAALEETGGMIYLAAESLGCDSNTIFNRLETNDELKEIVEKKRGKIDEMAKTQLARAIANGESWAIRFRLKQVRQFSDGLRASDGKSNSDGDAGDDVDAFIALPPNGREQNDDD